MTQSIVSATDGSRMTVDTLVGNPLMIPARILELLDTSFLTDVVFRDAGDNTNGLVSYEESTPLFLDAEVEDVAEFAEIPVGAGQRGLPRIAVGTKKGLGVRVSKEMRDENKLDDVNRQITQLTNTMIRADARALRAALTSATIPTIAATAPWGTSTSKARRDFANAQEIVASAKPAGATQEDVLGFVADTIIMPGSIGPVLMDDDDFLKVYTGDLAAESLAYSGTLPRKVLNMAPLTSRFWPADRALVLQRKVVGFRSDTRRLQVTPLYPEGNGPNGGPTESWRADATRKRVIGADQPLAACWVTGITEP